MKKHKCFLRQLSFGRLGVMLALLLATTTSMTATTVTTLGGGNPNVIPHYKGYRDGYTINQALFNSPTALAVDPSGQFLFVADRDNNAIRMLDLSAQYTWTFTTNRVNKPVGVAVDVNYNVYVLNQGTGKNGTIMTYDSFGEIVYTNATKLTNAAGMTMDNVGNIYVTVQSNKVIRIDAGTANQTTVATINIAGTSLQGIVFKHDGHIAACDSGRNGIYLIDPTTGIFTTNAGFHGKGDFITNSTDISSSTAAKFNQPMGIAESGDGRLVVSDYNNNRFKVVSASGVVSNLCGVTSQYWGGTYKGWYDGTVMLPDSIVPNVQCRQPSGIAIGPDGTIYTSEDYYHIIRKVTGSGLTPPPPPPPAAPLVVAVTASYGQISVTWSTSAGATNYNLKRATSSGFETTIATTATTSYTDLNVLDGTTYYYVVSALNTGGEGANSVETSATPLYSPTPTNLIVTATNYGLISLSWSSSAGATSYNLLRSPSSGGPYTVIGTPTNTFYSDTSVSNGTTYYYVVSAVNNGGANPNYSTQISATTPLPPVPNPQIGYVDFPATSQPVNYTSQFHPVSSSVFNNDTPIIIVGAVGSQTYYTYGAGTNPAPDPTSASASIPSGYQDGLFPSQVSSYALPIQLPDFTVKAIGEKNDGSPNSAIVQSRFQFVVGNPSISGNNSASFTITDPTVGAHLYYTLDGTQPSSTNPAAIDLGTVATPTNTWTVSFAIQTNTLFLVQGYRNNYAPSAVVSNLFTTNGFQPTTISFGFGNGEASSDFVASPGQTFYAPVTLNLVGNPTIYSLQFNLTVTNGAVNSGPPITPGNFGFRSMLEKPIPGLTPVTYEHIPPAMFVGLDAVPNPVTLDGSSDFSSLLTTNNSLNLLGVGWLERAGETNLYDTRSQTLISYSQAHDTQLLSSGGKVIVGGFNVVIPPTAQSNQTYTIQIGRPSATTDGIGAAGSDVYINAPTNGGVGAGTINALQYITVGQRKYIVGSVYPFNWFNAGDFGSSNIVNADVEQVFESAMYGLNTPPAGSDFFDAMDSSGNIGALDTDGSDLNNGYYTNSAVSYRTTYGSIDPLFDGDDTTINQDIFGNGILDVADVYVTFRRSLDPSLTWYRRFWNNGERVADTGAPNVGPKSKVSNSLQAKVLAVTASTNAPQVNFSAADVIGLAGHTVQIPINATILGNYPLRVLMLNLTVVPLDGSPALTTPVAFTQTATVLGAPYITSSIGAGNYAAVWLNSTNSGLTGTVTLGYLNVSIPAGAGTNAAYAIHFDHASASPNGLASFPNQKLTGLLTTLARTNSSYGDKIPDSWRLRWFGTVNNLLSSSNACPSGDGINNWMKYVAGVDPNSPNNFPSTTAQNPPPKGYTTAIHWPSVSGKQYVIESSSTLFSGAWSILSTNTGTGGDMEFDDSSSGAVKFYRVRILP